MAESKKKSHHVRTTVSSIAAPVASSIWISSPDGTQPVKCCFKVTGTADPNTYIHVYISEIGGVAIRDPHPSYGWADDQGNWSAYHCVPTPPPIAAGTVIRIRACTVNPVTGLDGHCVDVPVTVDCACPPPDDSGIA